MEANKASFLVRVPLFCENASCLERCPQFRSVFAYSLFVIPNFSVNLVYCCVGRKTRQLCHVQCLVAVSFEVIYNWYIQSMVGIISLYITGHLPHVAQLSL